MEKINLVNRKYLYHPWVFKDEIEKIGNDDFAVAIYNGRNVGYLVKCGSEKIPYRFIYSEKNYEDWFELFKEKFYQAYILRENLEFEAKRIFFAEADGFSGIVIDKYKDLLSIQLTISFWLGKEEKLYAFFKEKLNINSIVFSYSMELEGKEPLIFGEKFKVIIEEGKVKYNVDLLNGQKTGLFLDQRTNRITFGKWFEKLNLKTCLDVFCNVGGFGLNALASGAKKVIFVDIVSRILEQAKKNVELNNFEGAEFLKKNGLKIWDELDEKFDAVVVDPPAFAKKKKDLKKALKAYMRINIEAIKKVKKGGILCTSSCSGAVSMQEFKNLIKKVITKSGREATLLYHGRADVDHPYNILIDETDYLKCLIFRVL